MRIAEEVTFGGSSMDRAAHLRGDEMAQARIWAQPEAQVLAFWRGKPLIGPEGLVRLPTDHPALQEAGHGALRIFLGCDGGAPVFALDLSAWQPENLEAAALDGFLDRSEQRHPALAGDQAFAELRAVMTRLSPRDAELAATARALFAWHHSHGFCARCGAASEVSQAGWQRQCPACGAPHFPRTDPVVIMLITRGNKVLMGRSNGWPDRMYSLLAGFVEPGEPIEAAVRREVAEETGIRVGRVDYLASQPWPFPASLMIGCRGEALSDAITIDPHEIEDALWVPREEMLTAMAGSHPRITPARKGSIAHFLVSNWLADRLD
ncbi:NUDIX hydrolase [Defluviimonas sp. 20V17]|uniref:NAD(+) diphosphatase n=1 Tax=Allgaiera indica TaxID=765699 RepID=A0AAN4UNM9_9RHOB|nr:NAD(+) diphosphatase [Allgaiera indica]KDB03021.1 NUDIX hydrolase [Defluviimonas sp. 20V17]GHD98653.1 NADH pyrophosphatase [Allgaiera indica]SDW09096.1 NAD+ diphosphatase [Allgaiera indica]